MIFKHMEDIFRIRVPLLIGQAPPATFQSSSRLEQQKRFVLAATTIRQKIAQGMSAQNASSRFLTIGMYFVTRLNVVTKTTTLSHVIPNTSFYSKTRRPAEYGRRFPRQ